MSETVTETSGGQETYEAFLSKVFRRSHSINTKLLYHKAVKSFTVFLHVKTPYDVITIIKDKDPFEILDSYMAWLDKGGCNGKTQRIYLSGILKWLRFNDIYLDPVKIRDKVTMQRVKKPLDEAPSKQDLQKILHHASLQYRAIITLMASSGMGEADVANLRLKDIRFDEPVRILYVREKTDVGVETFITEETKTILAEYVKTLKDQNPNVRVFNQNPQSICKRFRYILRKAGFRETHYEGRNHRYKIRPYSLRKFFYSQCVSIVGEAVAHAWMGHETYLDTYLRISIEDRRDLYRRVMPKLSIYSSDKDEKIQILKSFKTLLKDV